MIRRLTIGFICIFLLVIGVSYYLYHAAMQGPEFYQQAVQVVGEQAKEWGDQLEDRVLNVHNQAVRENRWEIEIQANHLNGWLESQLKEKYPKFNPQQIIDPRVQFVENEIQLGFRLREGPIQGVVCIHLEPFLTSDQNNIGLRIHQIYMGSLPLSRKRVVEEIGSAADKMKINLAWMESEGKPVALVSPIFELEESTKRKIQVDGIKVSDGSLFVSGVAYDMPSQSTSKSDPLDRTTSNPDSKPKR